MQRFEKIKEMNQLFNLLLLYFAPYGYLHAVCQTFHCISLVCLLLITLCYNDAITKNEGLTVIIKHRVSELHKLLYIPWQICSPLQPIKKRFHFCVIRKPTITNINVWMFISLFTVLRHLMSCCVVFPFSVVCAPQFNIIIEKWIRRNRCISACMCVDCYLTVLCYRDLYIIQ